jgi:hypothetical protein
MPPAAAGKGKKPPFPPLWFGYLLFPFELAYRPWAVSLLGVVLAARPLCSLLTQRIGADHMSEVNVEIWCSHGVLHIQI